MSETSNNNKFNVNPEIFGNSQFCIQMGKTPIVFSLPEREHALFLALGMALAEIQSFETGIAFLLSSIANEAGRKVEEGYFDKLMQEYGSKTLGLLVKHFREVVHDEEISSRLCVIHGQERTSILSSAERSAARIEGCGKGDESLPTRTLRYGFRYAPTYSGC